MAHNVGRVLEVAEFIQVRQNMIERVWRIHVVELLLNFARQLEIGDWPLSLASRPCLIFRYGSCQKLSNLQYRIWPIIGIRCEASREDFANVLRPIDLFEIRQQFLVAFWLHSS